MKRRMIYSLLVTALSVAGLSCSGAPETHTYAKYGWGKVEMRLPVTRGAFAALVDELLDPFNRKSVDLYGAMNGE
jgi:hypothetical protein